MSPLGLSITLNPAAGCVKPGQACEHDLESVCGCACVRKKEPRRARVWGGGSRGCSSVKTNDARTDGTQHRQHVQFSFQLQQTDPRNGKCLHGMINDAVSPTTDYHQGLTVPMISPA